MSSTTSSKNRLLSVVCHGCTLFGVSVVSIAIPIIALFLADDDLVRKNAKESINFHLNIWFWAALIGGVGGFLAFITFGLGWLLVGPLLGLGFLWHAFWSVMAIIHSLTSNEPYRYPFILRIL
jgi:uncharacterized protein